MTTDQTAALYDAIDAFQRTHRLPGLQHAQIRGLLAEHLARALPAAVPVPPPADQTALRDRIAEALAAADGWQWAPGYDKTQSLAFQEYLRYADAVLAVLPEPDALTQARATNQRLNLRAQALESELAAYRRAVRQWEVSERGTYIPHSSLRAIGKACGVDILGTVRHLKHFERVEQAEAVLDRIRQMADYWEQQLPEVIRTPAVVSAIRAALERVNGPSRVAAEEQPAETPMFGSPDCTCIPFTRQGGKPRYCGPTDTVDMISGWEIGRDCPHHKPAVGEQPETQEADRG